ncbi:uncharacterized protein PAN0_004c2453 [Moesziomyces antarcticus]|uniref:Uncharacterized protein n=2 Tax=Pseudozyma antarctica TaxID=84753 RepID=A0A5C3FM62_PSEA2|nr:uncharacterized protein PAN0_004c2453 [Moesziomyces antarcticus]GAK64243.1 hypothetical protein PAN0_004c2453 [Moesziomyces antarcticus]SPO44529.1 uncharacterized protein PSANT_02214 [Moesziomyces antarcticus]
MLNLRLPSFSRLVVAAVLCAMLVVSTSAGLIPNVVSSTEFVAHTNGGLVRAFKSGDKWLVEGFENALEHAVPLRESTSFGRMLPSHDVTFTPTSSGVTVYNPDSRFHAIRFAGSGKTYLISPKSRQTIDGVTKLQAQQARLFKLKPDAQINYAE